VGEKLPAYNRGALYEVKSGRNLVGGRIIGLQQKKTSAHLIFSDDKSLTWNYSAPVAVDEKVTFNEASVMKLPKVIS